MKGPGGTVPMYPLFRTSVVKCAQVPITLPALERPRGELIGLGGWVSGGGILPTLLLSPCARALSTVIPSGGTVLQLNAGT